MKYNILIIDDNKDACLTLKDILEAREYNVDYANSGRDGIEKIKGFFFNLILVDIILHDISGTEVLKEIKKESPKSEIIVITGYASISTVIEAVNINIFSYIAKPFDMEYLLTTIAKALEKQKLSMDNEKMFKNLSILYNISSNLNQLKDIKEILNDVMDNITGLTPFDSVGIYLTRENEKILPLVAWRGVSNEFSDKFSNMDLRKGLGRIICEKREPIILDFGEIDNEFKPIVGEEGLRYIIFVPLVSKRELSGIIAFGSNFPVSDSYKDPELLKSIGVQIGLAINNAKLYEDVEELFMSTVKVLSSAIDAKSPWTRGHSERVTNYSVLIGERVMLDDRDIDDLEIAGLLHDIGKIGVIEDLLDKPGKLTDEEFAVVKEHPIKGAEILKPIKQFESIIPVIVHHHENFDGTGYPYGLKGENIPFLSRIISVADTYDAMTAERPYRPTPGREKAMIELKRCSGTQFDPELVNIFLDILKNENR